MSPILATHTLLSDGQTICIKFKVIIFMDSYLNYTQIVPSIIFKIVNNEYDNKIKCCFSFLRAKFLLKLKFNGKTLADLIPDSQN